MSRGPREYSASGIYHVMFRGSNKQTIFFDRKDYTKFLEILSKIKEKKEFDLYAYCLMNNHVHLVIKEKELRDISDIMKRLVGEYTQWFNFKYEKSGSLTENRYRSCSVETDEYFMHLIRYVHQNPIKAGLVERISDYEWSSYANYLDECGLINTSMLFEMLPKHRYAEFHQENETGEFALYFDYKHSDDDLIAEMSSMGIENVMDLKYMHPDKRAEIIDALKLKGFSLRCIARVTGISRKCL